MYNDFYGFTEKPFSLISNPNCLYLSSQHEAALTFLEYGLTERVGFVMLTGEIGIGKTTLIRRVLNQIEADMEVAVIFHTNISAHDLITLILTEFEIEYDNTINKAKALDILFDFLIKKYSERKKVLLVIDEAQNLADDVLEEIRMLSNLQTDDELLMQIMIVGQPDLKRKIQSKKLEQFAQRISVSYHISAMTLEETKAYISYRLEKAGCTESPFPEEVVQKIFDISAGIPRTINLLCDAALVYGYADEIREINLDIIEQVIKDKGGMGVLTRDKLDHAQKVPLKDDPVAVLEKRVAALEYRIDRLAELVEGQLKDAESRADSYRDETIANLKKIIEAERERSAELEYKYGKIQGRHDFAERLKKIK